MTEDPGGHLEAADIHERAAALHEASANLHEQHAVEMAERGWGKRVQRAQRVADRARRLADQEHRHGDKRRALAHAENNVGQKPEPRGDGHSGFVRSVCG